MRSGLVLALLTVTLGTASAQSVTPVLVDRDSLQAQIESLGSQIATVEARLGTPDAAQLNAARSELGLVRDQLRTLGRLVERAPRARGGGNRAVRFPPLLGEYGSHPAGAPPFTQAPAGPTPMDEGSFNAAIAQINQESFESDRMRIVRSLASQNYFLVAQVERVLPLFSFENGKLAALEILSPRILDRQNGYRLYNEFRFSSSKTRAEQILNR